MALRMHERGWRCFAPRRVVVYHQWSRAGRPSFREVHHPHRAVLERLSVGVVRKALGMLPGGNRTVSTRVAAYQRTCGVDFANETVSEFARNGGRAANAFVSATANAGQQLALAIFHKSSHAAVSEAQVQRPAQNVNAGDVVNDDGSGAGMMAELLPPIAAGILSNMAVGSAAGSRRALPALGCGRCSAAGACVARHGPTEAAPGRRKFFARGGASFSL